MLKALKIRHLITFFSSKIPFSYQTKLSYILPPPSTLYGVLAKNIALNYNVYAEAAASHEKYVDFLRKLKETVYTVRVKPLTPIIKNPSLIRQIRFEKQTSDAMVREYVRTCSFETYFIIDTKAFEKTFGKLTKLIAYPSDRIGDSESLATVTNVEILSIEHMPFSNGEVILDTYTPLEFIKDFNRGIVALLSDITMKGNVVRKQYLMPLEVIRKDSLEIYAPVKLMVKVEDGVEILKVKDGTVIPFKKVSGKTN